MVDPARAAAPATTSKQQRNAQQGGAGKSRNSNKKKREARPKKTLEDLDAEMEGALVAGMCSHRLHAPGQCRGADAGRSDRVGAVHRASVDDP